MSWAERKSLRKLSEKISNTYQNKKFHSFNTYIFKNRKGFYVKVYKPFKDSTLPPVCKILSPSDVSFQFHEYEEGESSFDDIKEVMQRQEMAIEYDREFEHLFRKLFLDPWMNDTTSVDVVDKAESELSKKSFYDEWYLWYVLIFSCGPWEAQFAAFIQLWHEYDRESFDDYYSKRTLKSSGEGLSSESIYIFIRNTKNLKMFSQNYFQNFF